MSNAISGHGGAQNVNLFNAANAGPAHPAQGPVATGNVNGQPFAAANAGGPASTGPGPLVAGLKSFGRLLAAPALAVAGKVEAHRTAKADAAAASARAAHTDRMVLRTALSSVGAGSILNQTLSVPDPNGGPASVPVPIDQLMEDYCTALQNFPLPGGHGVHDFTNATPGEVKAWVAMGEKICKAIYSGGGQLPLTIDVPIPGTPNQTRPLPVPANLDTTRAVAWFLTAQAMKDNHVAGQNPLHVASGTFIHKDPGNALMKFLQSSDKTYGRYSSHFNHGRAVKENDTPGAQRFQANRPILGWKQSLQNGIEDFTSKFPGNGGTMLFHELDEGDGEGRIFMKFESVGVPDAYRGGFEKHGDVEEEKATKGEALNRCVQHGANFSKTLGKVLHVKSEPKHTGMENRGEKLKQGGRVDLDAYDEIMEGWADSAQLSKGELKAGRKGDYVAGSMDSNLGKVVDHINNRQDGATNFAPTLAKINGLRQDIAGLGPTFGSVRAGAEVYSDAPGGLANKTMASLF